MVVDLALSLLLILAGFFGMLWLLLLGFGERDRTLITPFDDLMISEHGKLAMQDGNLPIVPMPEDVQGNDAVVTWMTQELPRLIAPEPRPRV